MALVGGVLVLTPSPASGADGDVSSSRAVARTCSAGPLRGAEGTASKTMRAASDGLLRTRLTGPGDWDVAVFDTASKKLVAASAGFAGTELAAGFVTKGQNLLVQACRLPGAGATANLGTVLEPMPTGAAATLSVVAVDVKDRDGKACLQGLGLDLTEHGTATTVEVVLHGSGDAQKLEDAGFTYRTEIADLAERAKKNRAADRSYASATTRSALPSGRDTYRRLADYEGEMKALAAAYPSMVKLLTLPNKSVEGRTIHGIEITKDAANVADGKPVFLNMGVHHAREWPSSEHAMEWAYELLTG